PVALYLDLLDFTLCFDVDVLELRLRRCERGLAAHRRCTGHQEHHVVCDQAKHFLDVARLGRVEPGGNKVPDRLLIVLHGASENSVGDPCQGKSPVGALTAKIMVAKQTWPPTGRRGVGGCLAASISLDRNT